MKGKVQSSTRNHKLLRTYHPDGSLASEDSHIAGMANGICRRWHPNGQLESEVSMVKGLITGRMRLWDSDGVLVVNQFYVSMRVVSKKRYDLLCEKDPSLPRFSDDRPKNTIGRWLAAERRRQRRLEETGLDEAGKEALKKFDLDCRREIRGRRTKELLSWLRPHPSQIINFGELTRREAIQFATELYKFGARKVYVIGIERDPDREMSARKLIVMLPTDTKARSDIFELCATKASSNRGVPTIGIGFKCLRVALF